MAVKKILVICSANMCRSPMGDGYLAMRLLEMGLEDVEVQSASVFYNSGSRATEGARLMAERNGFNLDFHVAQFLEDKLYDWADKILVMTQSHVSEIANRFPDDYKEKVHLLGSFDPEQEDIEVQDPYGSSTATYESVFEQIKRSTDAFIEKFLL
jgi:protein-tyrosine phosphatase